MFIIGEIGYWTAGSAVARLVVNVPCEDIVLPAPEAPHDVGSSWDDVSASRQTALAARNLLTTDGAFQPLRPMAIDLDLPMREEFTNRPEVFPQPFLRRPRLQPELLS